MSVHYYTHKLAKLMREGDGATISLHQNISDPASGYVVGGEGEVVKLYADREVHPVAMTGVIYDAMRAGHRYMGAWLDDGLWYVEPVAILTDREEAINLGHERGELAIYDLDTDKTIWLEGN